MPPKKNSYSTFKFTHIANLVINELGKFEFHILLVLAKFVKLLKNAKKVPTRENFTLDKIL